jgi:hypothetical protein
LHEKLAKLAETKWLKKRHIDSADIFNDIVRIVFTRGPIDLSDINRAFGDAMFYGGRANDGEVKIKINFSKKNS